MIQHKTEEARFHCKSYPVRPFIGQRICILMGKTWINQKI